MWRKRITPVVRRIAALATLAVVVSTAVASRGAAGGGTPITACGQVVTTSAFLTKSLDCPGSHGIVIGADGLTIDLRGFRLRGDRTALHHGIHLYGFDHVTLKNGVVTNFDYGVVGTGSDSLDISGLAVSGNAHTGISIIGAQIKIRSSTASGNAGNGIFSSGVSAKILSTTASGNVGTGIAIVGAASSVKSASVVGNFNGVSIVGDSATVQSSTASGNDLEGIEVTGDSAIVQSATASGNGIVGIDIDGDLAKVQSSTASGNGNVGVAVSGNSAVIKGNRADANGFPGGVSDAVGRGFNMTYTIPPVGMNVALGNDDPFECFPLSLC